MPPGVPDPSGARECTSNITRRLRSLLSATQQIVRCHACGQANRGGAFDVSSTPTLVVLEGGQKVDRIVGLHGKQMLAQRLEKVLS